MSRKRDKQTEKKVLGVLLWTVTAILLVFYFLKIREYRNRDIFYVLFSVILSGAATFFLPINKKRELTFLLWLFL